MENTVLQNMEAYLMPGMEGYRKIERINGVTYDMSPSACVSHGIINGNIYSIIQAGLRNSLCKVFIENLDLMLSEDEWVIPDVMIVCDPHAVQSGTYKGVPRFVLETLSPSSSTRDRREKKDKYAAIGVDEFWLIEPRGKSLEIYYLKNGHYVLEKSYLLIEDRNNEDYNADELITLRLFPAISMTLQEIFRDSDWGA